MKFRNKILLPIGVAISSSIIFLLASIKHLSGWESESDYDWILWLIFIYFVLPIFVVLSAIISFFLVNVVDKIYAGRIKIRLIPDGNKIWVSFLSKAATFLALIISVTVICTLIIVFFLSLMGFRLYPKHMEPRPPSPEKNLYMECIEPARDIWSAKYQESLSFFDEREKLSFLAKAEKVFMEAQDECGSKHLNKRYVEVFNFSGYDGGETDSFTITGEKIKIEYESSTSLSLYKVEDNSLNMKIYDTNPSSFTDTYDGNKGEKMISLLSWRPGEYYIESVGSGPYKVTVYDFTDN